MLRAEAKRTFVVVSEDQAKIDPYPYVYVNADASARELHADERKYLETPFDPFDGNRPYIKDDHSSKNGWGEIKGFIERIKLPGGIAILPAPIDNPIKSMSKDETIRFLREKGLTVTETSDSRIAAKKPGQ